MAPNEKLQYNSFTSNELASGGGLYPQVNAVSPPVSTLDKDPVAIGHTE